MVKVEVQDVSQKQLKCPECGSKELSKYGTKWAKIDGKRVKIKQFICKMCGRVTVNPKENVDDK